MTSSSSEVTKQLTLLEVTDQHKASVPVLSKLLPDVKTALFFAKAYDMNYRRLSDMLQALFSSDLLSELTRGEHSTELQDYLVEVAPDYVYEQAGVGYTDTADVPDTELLAQLFEAQAVEVADSIKKVAGKLAGVLSSLSSKQGKMTFQHMLALNKQRSSLGTYSAHIGHNPVPPRLVVLDVSGSMTYETISSIVSEVVGLAYEIEASLAIVSSTATLWAPGSFTVDDVMREAEFGGTQYEQLTSVMDNHWETVVCIADYDSSLSARDWLRMNANGSIGLLYDVSLVSRPTFLAECLGWFADEVKPLLVGNSVYPL